MPDALNLPLRRLAARLLDQLTVLTVQFILTIGFLFGVIGDLTDRYHPSPWGRSFVALIFHIILTAIYEIVFITRRGQTPGKDLLKLRVVCDDNGTLPSWRRAALRFAVPGLLRLVPGVALSELAILLSGATVPGSPQQRALHDMVAGTHVVYYDANKVEGRVPRLRSRPRASLSLLGRALRADLGDEHEPEQPPSPPPPRRSGPPARSRRS